MSSWQLIFLQSKVNNARYDGDRLVPQNLALAERNLVSNAAASSSEYVRKTPEELTQPQFAADSLLAT